MVQMLSELIVLKQVASCNTTDWEVQVYSICIYFRIDLSSNCYSIEFWAFSDIYLFHTPLFKDKLELKWLL